MTNCSKQPRLQPHTHYWLFMTKQNNPESVILRIKSLYYELFILELWLHFHDMMAFSHLKSQLYSHDIMDFSHLKSQLCTRLFDVEPEITWNLETFIPDKETAKLVIIFLRNSEDIIACFSRFTSQTSTIQGTIERM